MPAPNLTTLFDFEGQFEKAADEILANVLIDAYQTGGDQQLPLVNTGVFFDLGPAVEGKFAQLSPPSTWPTGEAGPQEYFIYTASLEFRVEVPRDDRAPTTTGVDTMLSQIRGKLREEMMQCVHPFNDTNLPYYKVARIRPDGSSSGESGPPRNADRAFIRYAINFEIKKNAWPAWVEA